ncbi:MAG: hypothetical protein ACT4O1_10465 [Gemmatimonadota bacterium]
MRAWEHGSMGIFGSRKKSGEPFEFRVSDAVEVPLRGYLLRLKLLNGDPALADIAPGGKIKLRAPEGTERVVTIKDYSATQGAASQKRLDRTRELDVMIEGREAVIDGQVVDIGWIASGPA